MAITGKVKPDYIVGETVKCVDDSHCNGIIVNGRTYTVRSILGSNSLGRWHVILVGIPDYYLADRFVRCLNQPAIITVPSAGSAAINNHTCPSCGNNRCSTSEKSCWLCGGKL